VSWIPSDGWVKINCDGAARGNPGPGGVGLVCRTKEQVLGMYVKGLSGVTNYEAKTEALVLAAKLASRNHWSSLWLQTDSKAPMEAFSNEMFFVGILIKNKVAQGY
ncbi:hypothetical protein FRX31_017881, partial [Thalictrum thalictroides]